MTRFCTASVTALFATTALLSTVKAQTSDKPDLSKQPTLYAVGYAHLDTEWRWEYPQVIDEYLRNTMEKNFSLLQKYPHYIFNFSGANRYRLMKEYFPEDFAKLKEYVAEGRWFPAGSSMEEGDVNAPSAEAIFRQILYGNEWFRKEFGKASTEYMLPDCFGFPSSLPTILASSGVKGFSTQKLTWGSSASGGGWDSVEKTPEGTPFNVGIWVGPDGQNVLAALNPGSYSGGIYTDLSKDLPAEKPSEALADLQKKAGDLEKKLEQEQEKKQPFDDKELQEYFALRGDQNALVRLQQDRSHEKYQGDWAARAMGNGNSTGLFTDYHYYGTGDIGGAPDEESVKRLEAIVTKGVVDMPPPNGLYFDQNHPKWPEVKVGQGPVQVISATADQMFLNITPQEAVKLPRYTGEMELTNHSAGSLTSQAYQKRWIRKEELLADAAEKSSIAAEWLGARTYPMKRLNDAWTLAMAAHFHDIAAGTATPKAYEFAWNDDVIAMNQFADVVTTAVEAVAGGMDTETKGVPLIVFNPLNVARQDVVEADVDLHGSAPQGVRVIAPDGKDVPSQIANGKVLFLASVPSVGYAIYDVQPSTAAESASSSLSVRDNELENAYYRVKLNEAGDVASIFDKKIRRELLSGPARLAISYDNPEQWPAWNMDWDQEQAIPKAYVSGPAKIRIVENGPVRVAIEVSRETAGSRFVQTIRLSAGEAGKRVEFGNVIDWSTKESNLKATFPLTASNVMATYNWGVGTILRPTAEPKKFEVPSHQWIDLTDMSQSFGATILTGSKNGSDKPDDHTIRLTLIRTPGVNGGYPDEATQDIGHHEFVYGIAGHADGWREAQTDWVGQELNAPLIAFETSKHGGALGHSFSLLTVNNPRIGVMALKKAEESDETIVRLVELDGKPQSDVHLSLVAPIVSAREVNGQEQPVGPARLDHGALVASFGAYQPRTFALKLGASSVKVAGVRSEPVELTYDLAATSNDGDKVASGFDGKGNAIAAEMLPSQITFNDVQFHLAPSKTGTQNALVAKGQTIQLPTGDYNRIYVLTASVEGDQKATFEVGEKSVDLNIQDWGGYIGQWDNRHWSPKNTSHDNYREMVGITPGIIKRANLAWYCSHHHDAAGKNIPYAYSYLFAYGIDMPAGAKAIKLPDNEKVRILAISVADENPETRPAQPLYDELPSSNAGPADFTLSASTNGLSIPQGKEVTTSFLVLPRSNFNREVSLEASGLPEGVTATFKPATTSGTSVMTLTASSSAVPTSAKITINGKSGDITHTAILPLAITQVMRGTVPVDLSHAYNVTGIYRNGSKFESEDSLDGVGFAFSEELIGSDQVGDGVVFQLGSANVADAVTSTTVELPSGTFSSLKLLAVGVEGTQESQTFTVNYADGTSSTSTQSMSDWANPNRFDGESVAADMSYRLEGYGESDNRHAYSYAYSIHLDSNKVVRNISMPNNRNVLVLAMTLVPAKK